MKSVIFVDIIDNADGTATYKHKSTMIDYSALNTLDCNKSVY